MDEVSVEQVGSGREQHDAGPLQTAPALNKLMHSPSVEASIAAGPEVRNEVSPPALSGELAHERELRRKTLDGMEAEMISRWQTEADSLRRHVKRLQAENTALREQLSVETAMKERYFQELHSCNEQLQRMRITPR